MATEYMAFVDILTRMGVSLQLGVVDNFDASWYGYPENLLGCATVDAATCSFVFDADGRYVGVGCGDEQPSFETREN